MQTSFLNFSINVLRYWIKKVIFFRLKEFSGYIKLDFVPAENKVKTTFISDLTCLTLPFAKGFIQRKSIPKKEYSEISLSRFLLDCGSDSSILSYKDFKRFRLFERKLSLCGQFNLRGSTGTVQNCFIGPIQVKLFLQAEDGRFYHENVKISVARESLELPSILGIDFLKLTKCNLSFNKETKIVCTMKD